MVGREDVLSEKPQFWVLVGSSLMGQTYAHTKSSSTGGDGGLVLTGLGGAEPVDEIGFILVNIEFAAHQGMPCAAEFSARQFPDHVRVAYLAGCGVIADFDPAFFLVRHWVRKRAGVVL